MSAEPLKPSETAVVVIDMLNDFVTGAPKCERAQAIIPNIRALRGVIPALKDIVGYMEDVALMGDRAGATEAAYSKMTGVLMHFYGQAKEAAKGILDALGEAIKKPLIDAAKLITQWSIAIIEVINNNRALVVAGMLVGVAVATLGVALVGLGVIVGGLSFAFGGLATAASVRRRCSIMPESTIRAKNIEVIDMMDVSRASAFGLLLMLLPS